MGIDTKKLSPQAQAQVRKLCPELFSKKGNKRNKYNAKKTRVDGILFDSKREAKRFVELKFLKWTGSVKYFFRQVIS